MPELDAAVITERVLHLLRTPLFEHLSPPQLETVAAAGREVVYPRRTVLVPEGQRPTALYVALTGRLRALHAGQPLAGDPVQQFYGGLGVLSGFSVIADIVIEPGTVLFVLDEDGLRSLLEENSSIARAMLRSLAARALDTRRGTIVGPSGSVRVEAARTGSLRPARSDPAPPRRARPALPEPGGARPARPDQPGPPRARR